MSTYPFESLPENLAAFCSLLRREHGFRIGPRELQDAARALELVELSDERAVRNALRPVLAGRHDDVVAFDAAFDRFFHSPKQPLAEAHSAVASTASGHDVQQPASGRDAAEDASRPDVTEEALVERESGHGEVHDVSDATSDAAVGLLRASYSPLDAEGVPASLEPVDRAWREAASVLVGRVRAGLSRRWRPAARGQRFDLRRTLRSSLHTGGEVVMARWRARPRRRPRFVLLVDGSRSMAAYTRPALHVAAALASVTLNVETFAFSTALRRVTLDVRRAAAGQRRQLRLQHAWGGGTTIGACLSEFVQVYGERLLGRDTVVIVASDGLDVGDPEVLREAMARLARHSAAVVWLNPLLETPGYEPTARGMSLARPFVTILTSVNDPAGLMQLARSMRLR